MHSTYAPRMSSDDMIEPTFNLRLIEAVRHSRCLFDSSDRQYRNTDYKNKVWNRLVTVLGFEGDPRSLASRWKQLRDKYGKEKRKQKYGADKSTWQYFRHLSFLDPHMTDRTDVSPSRKESEDVHLCVSDPNFAKRLINNVQRHPCLYDVRDPKYRHSEWRNQAWQGIISEIRFPGTVTSIYKQWKKHRDRYVREKRRLKSQQIDSVVPEISTWELYDAMVWMDQYLDDRASFNCSRIKRSSGPDNNSSCNQDDMSDFGDYEEDMNYVGVIMDKPRANEPHVMEENPAMGINQQSSGDVLLDGDSAFSASIVSDLRTLPESARLLAKHQIEILLETGKIPYFKDSFP